MVTHGDRKNLRVKVRRLTDASTITETVADRWCAHCGRWVTERGVTGALKFMAHDGDSPGICPVPRDPDQATPEAREG